MAVKKEYAFVLPRYERGIVGGAEALAGSIAERLAERGDSVEILTTCARDNRTWANFFEPGTDIDRNLMVKRFLVDDRNLDEWIPLQIRVSDGMQLSVDEQLQWMTHSVNSSGLYEYLAENGHQFDAIFFGPYLFGSTFWGSQICPERSILIPCLHDETYAHQDVIRAMFQLVRGAVFNVPSEMKLAHRLYGPVEGGEVGMGFEVADRDSISKLSPFFEEKFPYLLYLGRKETGKNVQVLIDHFIRLKERSPKAAALKLVVCGGGDFSDLYRPDALLRDDIIDMRVSEEEKSQLIRHALALVQPSLNESFSIVLMEAWVLETPVIVDARCAVTRDHVLESGGGLLYASQEDFNGVVLELLSSKKLRNELGSAGLPYVRNKYNWGDVIKRFDAVVEQILNSQTDKALIGKTSLSTVSLEPPHN